MEQPIESACAAAETSMLSYYDSFDDPSITNGFGDLDSPANLDDLMQRIQSSVSRSFVLDFNDNAAYAAFDLPTASLGRLLSTERPDTPSARWINIWYPYYQRPLLSLLAKQYDFSPRLLGLMCSDPRVQRGPPPRSHAKAKGKAARHAWSAHSPTPSEVEKGSDELSVLSSASASNHDSVAGGNLYRIVDDTWHYTTVDFGWSYVCIGYNSLYVLCEDNTVISINEDPFPYAEGRLDELQQRILQETQRNLVNVFRSLSRVDEAARMAHNPMTLLPLRTRLGDTPEETAHHEPDTPGLLLYYLFENFHNSYTLVTRKESRYGVELNELRAQMFAKPELCHIDRLDSIGKELGVLGRHYQSYMRIIDRILEPQTATPAPTQSSRNLDERSEQASLRTIRPLPTEKQETPLGVSLTSAARVRFQRLKDLIDLYALSEVDEYTKQKNALVALNFNLIALQESLAMERLTKVALLITKATILFLPVSLMSAYFGVDLGGAGYTVREYWVTFAVVLVCSWIAFFVFGVVSGSVQTVDFFVGLWAGLRRIWER
ncbi:hypothetical protein B0A55_03385 [Friedmanniomyces simplex]|uniref:ADP-ribosylation factor n=1 Tax=Friedmanniomyces simplex TaxID=329884 RepID=A0A4V5NHU0_9PEZI|nr:hypothetical protein B0A55_03385 [Friedmanniomyces simplex]